MGYRLRKQLIIVIIVLVVLGLLGAGVYYNWFYQGATCFDNKQNQGEAGVDCGGPCAMSCEILTVKNLEVQWAKAIFLKEGVYDLVAQVDNINPNYGLGSFNYSFKLYDVSDQLVGEKPGTNFILPNQKKYIVEANVAVSAKPARAELIITPPAKTAWQRLKDNFELPDIFVQNKQFEYLENQASVQAGTAQASGVIKNNSNFDLDKISVAVVLFDANKEIVGVNKTDAYTIPAGEERYFSVLWFSPLSGEVKSVDILADTNLFSDSNFMKRYGTATEKFQEY